MADDMTRRAIRVWMRDVMGSKGWSANRWATLAGTSPTNITRFLSPSSNFAPSSATLTKLIKVAGSQPNLGCQPSERSLDKNSVPILSWDQTKRSLVPTGQRIITTTEVSAEAFVVVCQSDAMNLSGIMEGDLITVEPAFGLAPKVGRIVIARYGDGLIIGEYQPPFIIPKSTNPLHRIFDISICTMIGTLVTITRQLK